MTKHHKKEDDKFPPTPPETDPPPRRKKLRPLNQNKFSAEKQANEIQLSEKEQRCCDMATD